MTNQFISIKEASSITGKHSDTIRRLVKANKTNSQKIVRGKQGQYLIDKDWLLDHFETPQTQESHREPVSSENRQHGQHVEVHTKTAHTSSESTKNASGEVLQALQSQLEAKDRQIDQLHQIINEKEANTTKLQDQFQQMLHANQQLPQQSTVDVAPVSRPENAPTDSNKKQGNSGEKAVKTKPKKQKKTGKAKSKNSGKTRAKTEKQKPKKKWWKL